MSDQQSPQLFVGPVSDLDFSQIIVQLGGTFEYCFLGIRPAVLYMTNGNILILVTEIQRPDAALHVE